MLAKAFSLLLGKLHITIIVNYKVIIMIVIGAKSLALFIIHLNSKASFCTTIKTKQQSLYWQWDNGIMQPSTIMNEWYHNHHLISSLILWYHVLKNFGGPSCPNIGPPPPRFYSTALSIPWLSQKIRDTTQLMHECMQQSGHALFYGQVDLYIGCDSRWLSVLLLSTFSYEQQAK